MTKITHQTVIPVWLAVKYGGRGVIKTLVRVQTPHTDTIHMEMHISPLTT